MKSFYFLCKSYLREVLKFEREKTKYGSFVFKNKVQEF